MAKISLVIISFNEADNIRDCIESAQKVVDEVVVVDSGSTDATEAIAVSLGARVVRQPFLGHVQQKTFATSLAANPWILSLDADERLSSGLSDRIMLFKNKGFSCDCYRMKRRTWYMNGWYRHGGWYPDTRIRLFSRDRASWAGENPHDYVLPASDARIGFIDADILHFTYRSLAAHFDQIQKFSSIAAGAARSRTLFPTSLRLWIDPLSKFIKTYILQRSFLDGSKGFIFSAMAAISVFMKYAKRWELEHSNDKNHKAGE
jgi:glycosyltransferase involved in cell wall biosynthesis